MTHVQWNYLDGAHDKQMIATQAKRWQDEYTSKLISPSEAAQKIRNGDRIYIGSLCSEPKTILRALETSYAEDVELVQFIRGTEASRLASDPWGRFRIKTFFAGGGDGRQGAYALIYFTRFCEGCS